MTTPESIVHRYVAAMNAGDLDALCACFTEDALVWGVLGWGSIPQVKEVWRDLMDCLRIQLQVDAMISQGDTVCVRYTERGTSEKAFRGQGPTGKSYEITAMEWFEVRGGLIHRRWGARDSTSLNRQLGFG